MLAQKLIDVPQAPQLVFNDDTQRVLGSLKTATWIYDVEKKSIPWANQSACALWGAKDLGELLQRDFSDISQSALARLMGYFDRIHSGEIVAEQWTFYPNGREKRNGSDAYTVTATCTYSIILLDGVRAAFLIEGIVKDRSEINVEHLRIIESMRHAPMCMAAYTTSGALLYQNPKSILTYRAHLSDQHKMFEQFAEPEAVGSAMRQLLQEKVYQAEHQVHTTNNTVAWHEILAREINDPVSGQPIYLVIESNIDSRKTAEQSLERAHGELKHNHALIRTMLESIDQAFLIFDRQGICSNIPSEKSKMLLGIDPSHLHLSKIIESESANEDTINSWFNLIFEQRLSFEDLVAHGPTETGVKSTGATLRLKFHPMRSDDGQISALIFTATDITREIAKTKSAEAERKRAEMTIRIVEFKPSFRSFLSEFEKLYQDMANWDGEHLFTVQQDLHTLKGAAMLYSASVLATEVYETELRLRMTSPEKLQNAVKAEGTNLGKVFAAWKSMNTTLLKQLGIFGDEAVEVPVKTLRSLPETYGTTAESRALLSTIISNLLAKDLGDLLKPFEKHVADVAARMSKMVRFKAVPVGEKVMVDPSIYHVPIRSLVHIFNNAVDHGFELPQDRLSLGKPEAGTLAVSYERWHDGTRPWLRLIISDDGQGINVTKLRAKLIRKAKTMSDLEIASEIFTASLSTNDSVTELSGQGVGMTAVYNAILNFGGEMKVIKTDTQGTIFEVLLPDLIHL